MKKLALIDLDGTLLGPKKTISPANLEALSWLEEAGFTPAIASGRHHVNILQYQDRLDLRDWIVSTHGAVVQHATTGETLHEMVIPVEEVQAACRFGATHGLTLLAHHATGVVVDKPSRWSGHYAQGAGWEPVPGNLEELAQQGFMSLLFSSSKAHLDKIQEEAYRDLGSRNHVIRTENELLEMIVAGANKAVGGQTLAQKLGIDRTRVLAFGDANNDLEMLRWAGLSVAMAHGTEAARQSADLISPLGPPEEAFARAVELALNERQQVAA